MCEITLGPHRTRTARNDDPLVPHDCSGNQAQALSGLGPLFPVGLPGSWLSAFTSMALDSLERNVPYCT